MGRRNRTGERGLFLDVRHFDETGAKVSAERAKELAAAGRKVKRVERYGLDIQVERPNAEGRMVVLRHRGLLPPKTTSPAAQKKCRDIRESMEKGTYTPGAPTGDAPRQRLHKAIDAAVEWAKTNRPRSHRGRKSLAAMVKANLTDRAVEDLEPADLEDYKARRLRAEPEDSKPAKPQAGKVGPATVNREVALVKHAAKLWREWGWISSSSAAAIRAVGLVTEPAGRVRYLVGDEEARLFAHLEGTIKRIAQVADLTGMRRAEVVRLQRSAVDVPNRAIVLTKTKTDAPRTVPLNAACLAILEAQLASTPASTPWVFPSRLGKPYNLDAVTRAFRKARVAAGIDDLRLHDLRHDAATKIRRAGHGLDVIGALLGHSKKSIRTTMRYAHVETDLVRAAVDSMPAPASDVPKPRKASAKAARARKDRGGITRQYPAKGRRDS